MFLLNTVSVSAASAVAPTNHSTDLTSLNYYSHRGLFEVSPHVTTLLKDRTDNSNGGHTTTAENQFYGALTYGLTDRLRLSITETLLWDQSSDAVTAKGVETTSVSSGLSNPTLIASWRYLEAKHSGLSGDLTLELTPSLGHKINADGSVVLVGNNLSGDWVEQLASAFFWSGRKNQIELAASLTGNSPITAQTSSGTSHTDQYFTTAVTLTERYHFGKRHFVQAAAEFLPKSHHFTKGSAGASGGNQVRSSALSSLNDSLMFGYSPDRLVVLEVIANFRPFTSQSSSNAAQGSSQTTLISSTLSILHEF